MASNSSAAQTGALVSSPWQIYRRVVGALLIRELLTRYGRNNIGFLWLFVEPATFILLITLIRGYIRGAYPNLPVAAFALSGYASVLMWRNAVSRVMGALKSNKPLLYHRHVTIMDIFTARIALELIAITATLLGLSIVLWAVGLVPLPEDFLQVLAAWFLLAWFAIGLALTMGALAQKADVIVRIWHPFSYILMINSGAFFIVDVFPPTVREYMLWVPPLDGVEYMRDGWFGSSFTAHYDLSYFVAANFVLTVIGLTMVRQLQFDSSSE